MFITVKKRVALLVIIAFVAVVSVATFATAPASSSLGYGKVVVIDAGHGGEDGGVVGSTTGVKESDINLAISKKLKDILQSAGYRVVMTRPNSDGLYGAVSSNKKLADMKKRKEIILNAEPSMVVSIHQNYYPSSYVSGAQVFYSPSGKDEEAATAMQKILNRELDCSRKAAKGDYYIVQCSPYPSVLIECGFLSNPIEETLLVSAEYQQKVAYAVYAAVNFVLDGTGH